MNGNRMIYAVVGSLTAFFIVGCIAFGMATAGDRVRITTVEKVQEKHSAVIADVPVIVNEIGHIKTSIEDIESKQDEILDAIKELR